MEVLGKLGIDFNSVVLYLLNFGILFAVVAYLITGPILRMIDQRTKTIKDNLEEAENIKREFLEEKKRADQEKASLKTEMSSQMAHLKKDLEKQRKDQEEEMNLRKAKMLEEVRTIVEEEKKNILKKAEQQTIDLVSKVVMHIVSQKIPKDVLRESVVDAWKKYHTTSP